MIKKITYITLWIYLRFVEKNSCMYKNAFWFAFYANDTKKWVIELRKDI